MSVFVLTGVQTGFTRFVQDSMITILSLAQMTLKPKRFAATPRLLVSGVQSDVGLPPNVVSHPMVPGR